MKPIGVVLGWCRAVRMFHHGYEASARLVCQELSEFDSLTYKPSSNIPSGLFV